MTNGNGSAQILHIMFPLGTETGKKDFCYMTDYGSPKKFRIEICNRDTKKTKN